jgi:hypothetical protein
MNMNSLKGILEKCMENPWKMQKNFNLEVMEINEIAEKLFVRIDQKIKTLKTIETRADEKIAILDGLITKFKKLNFPSESLNTGGERHQKEVLAMSEKGFNPEQVARILDLPKGEVELILNLVHQ